MAKKLKTGRLLVRLGIIVLVIGMSFVFSVRIIRLLSHPSVRQVHKKYDSFDVDFPAGYGILGIDVSRHQEEIDWRRVDSMRSDGRRIRFVFIKASEGITRQDPAFEKNWKAIRNTRLIRGAYHFYYPSRDAKKQALNFISMVNLVKGDLPPVVDIEYSGFRSRKKICEGLSVFLKVLEKKYKVKPIIYTNLSFYKDYLTGEFESYPLWISCYFEEERFRASFDDNWILWQFSEQGHADGISGKVDFNVFNGNEADLKKLCLP